MTQPAQYRVPLTEAAGHVYLSANSLAWNRATGGQDPPEYCRTVAAIGWPVVDLPEPRVIDGEVTASWAAGAMEVGSRA